MKKRLLKVLSIPTAVALFIPIVALSAIVWIISGKHNPTEMIDKYFNWLSK